MGRKLIHKMQIKSLSERDIFMILLSSRDKATEFFR